MDSRSLLVALVVGVIQGVFEWLPISSEGNITLFLTAIAGASPELAVRYSLFLHAGTAVSATVYYRGELRDALSVLPRWRPAAAFGAETADLSFLGTATLVSGFVAIAVYAVVDELAAELPGGLFIAAIGVLLVITGLVQRAANSLSLGRKERPDALDALLVGVMQGLAIIPGISRSGATASALLFRGYDGPEAFRLSFLLSIPAALGAGVLVILDAGGLPGIGLGPALVALATSAVVGYLSIDALMRVVRRVAFWGVCVGLGALAIIGGVVLV